MIFYSIKSIIRQLKNSGKYTVLNILGLAMGLCLTTLIVMLLNFEISFDKFHSKSEQIVSICMQDKQDGSCKAYTPNPLPQTLKNDFPEVEEVVGVNLMLHEEAEIKYQDLSYFGLTGAAVDTDIFSMFDFQLILGEVKSVLDVHNKIVISESTSQKIFGLENPVGKELTWDKYSFTVSGVFQDLPEHSSLNFDILFSEKLNKVIWDRFPVAWWSSGTNTFVILQDGTNVKDFEAHLNQIPGKYYPSFLKSQNNFYVKPFKELHFDSSLLGGLVEPVSKTYLVILGVIALLTLFIAVINFVSLSTAQSHQLNIDSGIRRISGASPWQIIGKQLKFSLVTTIIALLVAVPLCWFCLPYFESFVNRTVQPQFGNLYVWSGVLAVSILLAFFSGIIPGVVFSKVQPIQVIRNNLRMMGGKGKARGGYIIFQFGLTIILITAQMFVYKQISDMKNANPGFDNNNLTSIGVSQIEAAYHEKYNKAKLFRAELEKYGSKYGFGQGAITENVPGYYFQNNFIIHPQDSKIDECKVISTAIDENYLDVYKVQLAHGRFFSPDYATDKQAFIINETAMKKFGWDNIDNKFLSFSHEGNSFPVVGVLKDITTTTLKNATPPMVFRYGQHNGFPAFLTFRINPEQKEATLKFFEETWTGMFPETPFINMDVKEVYFKNYESEQELGQVISIFSFFAIFLSGIGLFGMASFLSENRTKEIGIRKVNGAEVSEVLAMLNKDFVKWVAIAFVIACPIAYYAMNKWLENFAYKTTLSWWIFALAGVLALGIALLTVSFQSWKAATRNPVEALRYE